MNLSNFRRNLQKPARRKECRLQLEPLESRHLLATFVWENMGNSFDDSDDFKDMNQGAVGEIDVDAAIYVSFFDPSGNAVMPKNAASLRPGTALLWINANDFMKRLGPDYAFSKAPPHPLNEYIDMSASHKGLPAAARNKVVKWIRSFK